MGPFDAFLAINFPLSIWFSAQKSLMLVENLDSFTVRRITSAINFSISCSVNIFFGFFKVNVINYSGLQSRNHLQRYNI